MQPTQPMPTAAPLARVSRLALGLLGLAALGALGLWALGPRSAASSAACAVPPGGSDLAAVLAAKPAPGPLKRVRMSVEGMACVTCIGPIERKMIAATGVYRVRVLPQERAALVDYDPAQTDVVALMQGFDAIGYPAQTWTEGAWIVTKDASEAHVAPSG